MGINQKKQSHFEQFGRNPPLKNTYSTIFQLFRQQEETTPK